MILYYSTKYYSTKYYSTKYYSTKYYSTKYCSAKCYLLAGNLMQNVPLIYNYYYCLQFNTGEGDAGCKERSHYIW